MAIIVKINDRYCEWSTVVDAPLTHMMPLEEFKNYYAIRYGTRGMEELELRLQRVESTGTSSYLETLESLTEGNRAGENESNITLQDIYKIYSK